MAREITDAIDRGQRWWQPYVRRGATKAEKVQGLIDSNDYWHAVATSTQTEVERLREENDALRSLDTYGGLLSLATDLQQLANYAALLRDHQEPGHSRLRVTKTPQED